MILSSACPPWRADQPGPLPESAATNAASYARAVGHHLLNIIDEFTRECLAIRIGRKLKAVDVIDTLSDLFILRGVPGHIRSDNVLRAEGNGACSQSLSVRQHALAA